MKPDMKHLRLSAILALLLPSAAFAQTVNSFQALVGKVVAILNAGAILLIAVAVVVYFYTIVGNIFQMRQGETSSDLKNTIVRGMLVIFVMVSIWGIIQFLQYSLFGGPPPAATNGVIIYSS